MEFEEQWEDSIENDIRRRKYREVIDISHGEQQWGSHIVKIEDFEYEDSLKIHRYSFGFSLSDASKIALILELRHLTLSIKLKNETYECEVFFGTKSLPEDPLCATLILENRSTMQIQLPCSENFFALIYWCKIVRVNNENCTVYTEQSDIFYNLSCSGNERTFRIVFPFGYIAQFECALVGKNGKMCRNVYRTN
jgi:hypothetical protein